MRKNAFVAIAHIRELNLLKAHMIKRGEPLEEGDFRRALKTCGLPSNSLFWIMFKKAGLVQIIEGNLFVWASKKPVHYKALEDIYSDYQKKVNEYAKSRYAKVKEKKGEEQKKIEDAIALLKSKGYEVFVPCKDLFKKIQAHPNLICKDSNIFGVI